MIPNVLSRSTIAHPSRWQRLNGLVTLLRWRRKGEPDKLASDCCSPSCPAWRASLHRPLLHARAGQQLLSFFRRAWPLLGRHAGRQIAACLAMLLACGAGLPCTPAYADPVPQVTTPQATSRSPWAALIAEAAARFTLPQSWLAAVMAAESGGDPAAVSPAGAMGLMQLMPATWRSLSRRYGLGDDPFEPRANILAGAAYLRALHDRYGSPGFLAAYNAGPGRYEAYRRSARPLPSETMRYVARLASRLALPGDFGPLQPSAGKGDAGLPDWRAAPLFSSSRPPSQPTSRTSPLAAQAGVGQMRDGLFPGQWRSLEP